MSVDCCLAVVAQETIKNATETLVVLDRPIEKDGKVTGGAQPLTRLWCGASADTHCQKRDERSRTRVRCLYEIGFTPNDKLHILTSGFSPTVRRRPQWRIHTAAPATGRMHSGIWLELRA